MIADTRDRDLYPTFGNDGEQDRMARWTPALDDGPAETWCERCPEPTERTVTTSTGDHALCHDHAATLEYKSYSPAWRTSAGQKGATK